MRKELSREERNRDSLKLKNLWNMERQICQPHYLYSQKTVNCGTSRCENALFYGVHVLISVALIADFWVMPY